MTSHVRTMLFAAAAMAVVAMPAAAEDTVKLAYIDPLSGGGASIGEMGLKEFNFLAEVTNANGGILGHKLEIVPYDNKLNAQETLVQVQKAIDSGIRFITQGNGSAFAAAIEDFVQKYNERNPGKEVLYFNYAAVDPVLTNDKCSYWHFRWDANSDIKMSALTNYMKTRTNIKKVYLINQDYSFGQAVRKEARAMLNAKRPDIQIVGDEVHPLLKVTDFSPYIAKINASGADSVITGNWGQDFALLLKAAADAGLQVDWYTYYAGGTGGPTAVKQANLPDRVFAIAEGVANEPYAPAQEFEKAFRAKAGVTLFYPRAVNEIRMFVKAAQEANSLEPVKIAAKLDGMQVNVYDGGDGFMRSDDHQFFQPMYLANLGPLGKDQPFDEENTGWGWKMMGKIETQRHHPSDQLQDEPPELTAPSPAGSARARHHIDVKRRALRHAAVPDGERPHADLQHDGGAQLRPRQLLHAGRVLRLSDRPDARVLAGLRHRAGAGRRHRRADRTLRAALRAPARSGGRTPVHVRARLRHRGNRADDLGQGPGRLSRSRVA